MNNTKNNGSCHRKNRKIIVGVRLIVFTLFITTADAYIYKYLHYRTRCTLSNIGIQCPDVTSCGGLRYSLSSAGRSCGTNAPTDIVEPSVVFRTTREGRESNVIFRSGFSCNPFDDKSFLHLTRGSLRITHEAASPRSMRQRWDHERLRHQRALRATISHHVRKYFAT